MAIVGPGNFTIPQFKEKIIYFNNDKTEREFSYYIASSYKGILRLSPNDDYSLIEENGVRGWVSRDPVGDKLAEQFVRVSTSDGYFVNWRLSTTGTEFDNLYVIGPAFQGILRIYSENNEALLLDSINYLPSEINNKAQTDNSGKINNDTTELDISESLDNTYLVVGKPISGKRKFTYEQLRGLIKTTVMKKLSEQDTMPTGSIHYTPITLTQYQALINKGHYPNRYRVKGSTETTDPIIRDFLICDGSLYNNEDFPELAKALYEEKIQYWAPSDDGVMKLQETHINDYKEKKCFRVPDLRRMFTKSVYLTDNEADINDENAPWTDTGQWTNDSRPKDEASGNKKDYHRHFIASAHYQKWPLCNRMGDAELNAKVKVKYNSWRAFGSIVGGVITGALGGALSGSLGFLLGGKMISKTGQWLNTAMAGNLFGLNGLGESLGLGAATKGFAKSLNKAYKVDRQEAQWKLPQTQARNPIYGSAVELNEDGTDYVLNTNFESDDIQGLEDNKRISFIGKTDSEGRVRRGRASILAPKNNMSEFVWPSNGDFYNPGKYEYMAVWAGGPMLPAGYFLSIPKEFDYHSFDTKQDANAVLSSEDITSCLVKPQSDDDISYEINGNIHEEYVDFFDNNSPMSKTYGYENVPEYVALLPLIKI